jgi:hypothetical protein
MGSSGAQGDGRPPELDCMGIMPITLIWHDLDILAKLNIRLNRDLGRLP